MRKLPLIPVTCVVVFVALLSIVWSRRDVSPQRERVSPAPVDAAAIARAAPSSSRAEPRRAASWAPSRLPDPSRDQPQPVTPQPDALEGIEPLKRPLILAIRDARTDLVQKRRAMLKALEDSGESHESWTAGARAVFDGWRAQLPAELQDKLALREVRCYRAGCAVDVDFESDAEYLRAASLFRGLKDAGHPHGGRVQTPPEPRAGSARVASWIMLSPSEEQLEAAKGV